jgi:hypothetical protein
MVRDEADIIEPVVRHMLGQVDRVIVADNGSTDGTREILETLDVELLDDPEVGYYQSRKMTALAERARKRGATWVVPFDADEVWYSPFGRIADVLTEAVTPPHAVASAELYDHVATALDPADPNPVTRMQWRRRRPAPLPKVAAQCRPGLVIRQGNHSAHYDIEPAMAPGLLVVRHFPYRSAEQVIRKIRNGAQAYAATGDDLPADAGAHWRSWGRFGDDAIADLFRTWHWRAQPAAPLRIENERQDPLIRDPAPWAPA